MVIDEATDFSKAVSNSNQSAALFVLMPAVHAATDRQTVVSHRRLLEDKLMQRLGPFLGPKCDAEYDGVHGR